MELKTKRNLIVGGVAVATFAVLMLLTTSFINIYKEGQFAQRQAELQRQLDEQKIAAGVQKGLADKAAEEGKLKDDEIKQLKEDNARLAEAAESARVVYVRSRQPVAVRPFDGNIADTDVRAAATRAGLVIRSAP
jgi:hypothetical protein